MKNKEDSIKSKSVYPQGWLVCSVCGEEFEANDDTRYIIAGGYVCSWKKCFLAECKKREEKKNNEDNKKNKK